MQATLLETKLYRPKKIASFLRRQRLIDKLDEGKERSLTLVCAPAGFGKTTLLSDWIQTCDQPVAWLSLDSADNDSTVFLTYLVTAAQQIDKQIGASIPSMVKSSPNLPVTSIIAKLTSDIAEADTEFNIILDDYHMISNPSINEGMAFLIDHQPKNMRLLIAGRSDPPLPLARLRVQEELTEIRASDLRFTQEEVSIFLNDIMQLGLSKEEMVSLDSRTEGWIASLQLAALSLKGRDDKKGFVSAFSGSHRHIFDYLVDEVLSGLPDKLQEFLLGSSILDRFCAPLCDYLFEISDSHMNLLTLEQENLFIIPLDDERRWWRYHHLFADFLSQRLKQQGHERMNDLHRRAAVWLAKEGFLEGAVEHALTAKDFELAADFIEPEAINMVAASQVVPLLNWTASLPDEVMIERPILITSKAWALLLTGRVAEVEKYLSLAESSIKGSKDKALVEEILCHTMSIRSYIAIAVGDPKLAVELSIKALKLMPDNSLVLRAALTLNLSNAYMLLGEINKAALNLREALKAGEVANYYVAMVAYGLLANVMLMQGMYDDAAYLLRTALTRVDDWGGGQPLPAAGYVYLNLASILLERNELESARSQALKGIVLCEQVGQVGVIISAYLRLSLIELALGNLEAAKDAIAKASEFVDGSANVSSSIEQAAMSAQLLSFEAKIHMVEGDEDRVRQWLSTIGDARPVGAGNNYYFDKNTIYFDDITAAEALIFTGQAGVALEMIDDLLEGAKSQGRQGHVAEILALKALALNAAGEREQALEQLTQALNLAEAQGRIRLFIDLGRPMLELLRELPADSSSSKYVKKLIKLFQSPTRSTPVTPESGEHLIDSLSEREMEVLHLIVDGLKYQDIADKLVVSINTVRTHTKNIYSKLAVNSGNQAIKKATELGLL